MSHSSVIGICDKERIILYNVDKDGSADRNNPIYENHWKSLFSDNIEGANLKKLIGREIISKI